MLTWRKSALFVLVFVLSIAMIACGSKPQEAAKPADNATASGSAQANPLAGKKIALIMQINLGTFSAQYIEGVKEQVEKLGGTVTVNPADGDLAKMSSNLDAAINQKVDGILIDHGTAEALEAGVKRALEKKNSGRCVRRRLESAGRNGARARRREDGRANARTAREGH